MRSGYEEYIDRLRAQDGHGGGRGGSPQPRNWELLAQLAENAGLVMMHGELLSRIWGPEYRNETQYLRTWASRLRAKLEPEDSSLTLITTQPGIGYRFESPGAS